MFKISVRKFLHISMTVLLVLAFPFGASGVRAAGAQQVLSEGCATLAFFHSVGPF